MIFLRSENVESLYSVHKALGSVPALHEQVWWHTALVQSQKDQMFKVIFCYITNLRPGELNETVFSPLALQIIFVVLFWFWLLLWLLFFALGWAPKLIAYELLSPGNRLLNMSVSFVKEAGMSQYPHINLLWRFYSCFTVSLYNTVILILSY